MIELLTFTLTFLPPTLPPDLVLITKTPLAAPVPQTAAAAAPFNTVTLSISSELISFKRDCCVTPSVAPPILLLETGTPSRMIKG